MPRSPETSLINEAYQEKEQGRTIEGWLDSEKLSSFFHRHEPGKMLAIAKSQIGFDRAHVQLDITSPNKDEKDPMYINVKRDSVKLRSITVWMEPEQAEIIANGMPAKTVFQGRFTEEKKGDVKVELNASKVIDPDIDAFYMVFYYK